MAELPIDTLAVFIRGRSSQRNGGYQLGLCCTNTQSHDSPRR